jgi:hypothetical protein
MARKEESQREKRKAVQIKDSCYFYDLSLGTNRNQRPVLLTSRRYKKY